MSGSSKTFLQNLGILIGRALISALFIFSGLNKIIKWNESFAFVATLGLPMPKLLLGIALALELIGGIFVLVGYRARLGAFMLLLFLLPTNFIVHAYWGGVADAPAQMLNFWKNMSLCGGLLVLWSTGPGDIAIE